MPIEQLSVQLPHSIQSPTFLTLNIAKELGNFKKAPQGHKKRQNPFLPKKYTIKNYNTKQYNTKQYNTK